MKTSRFVLFAVWLIFSAALVLSGCGGAGGLPGILDSTFGTNGLVIYDSGNNDSGRATVLDSSGWILVVGYSNNGSDTDMALWRFDTDGSPDTNFGTNGLVTYNGGAYDSGKAVVLDSFGRILAAGVSSNGSDFDMALWRFDTNGSPDTTFGANGLVVYDGGSYDGGDAVILDSTGRILVAGYSRDGTNTNMALWRFAADGSPDTTFGTNGLLTYDGGAYDYGNAVAVDSFGRILVAGLSSNGSDFDMALWRFAADGSPDTTFGTNGLVIYDGGWYDSGRAAAMDSSGRILVAGYSENASDDDMALWRFTSDGSTDTTFGTSGLVIYDGDNNDSGNAVILDGAGRILITGYSRKGSNDDMALWRFAADGSQDTTFGDNWPVTYDGGSYDGGEAVILDSAGRILVTGYIHNGSNEDMALWRWLP